MPCLLLNKLDKITNITQPVDFTRPQPDGEMRLDRQDDRNLTNRVPAVYVVGSRLARNGQRLVADGAADDIVQVGLDHGRPICARQSVIALAQTLSQDC